MDWYRLNSTTAARLSGAVHLLDVTELAHIQPYLDELGNGLAAQTRSKLTALGRYLYALLFTGAVQAHFAEVVWPLVTAGQEHSPLTITLTFQPSDQYSVRQAAALPWEFIYCPLAAGILAMIPRLTWARRDSGYPPPQTDALVGVAHLRVLLVHLQPADTAPVSLARIRNVLEVNSAMGRASPRAPH